MKRIIFTILFLFALSTSYAALPPLYHTLNEIKGIINDERLTEMLGSAEGITKIERNENGYLVTSYRYQIQVDVNYLPQPYPGSGKFELKFHEKVPIESTFLQNQ